MSNGKPRMQYAALPFRRRADATIEILLITSRDTGRWLIPKGWPMAGLSPQDAAAREAREEGGIVGRIAEVAVGRYHYDKRLDDGTAIPCAVEVFVLEVERQMRSWPERAERRTQWFVPEEAAAVVQEPELQAIIQKLAKSLAE
jgi:8-oxo-dGTP pyrophosphatase MutT (NUDIX family)